MASGETNVIEFFRGTTPTIIVEVADDIDLLAIASIWLYISQNNKLKVDKNLDDVVIDVENKTITLSLSQDDTLELKKGDAIFQIRCLLFDGSALATYDVVVHVLEVYKGGVIT